MADSRVHMLEESADIEVIWRRYTRGRTFSPKVWNDAYLTAFAITENLTVVTFDGGFKQYGDSGCILLE